MGFTALPLCPHKVKLSFIQVLGGKQELARETLSLRWEHIDLQDNPILGYSQDSKCVVLKILLNFKID